MREESAGLISKVEYRERIFGETEEIAKKKIQEIEESNPDIETLLGTKQDNNKGKEEDKAEDKKEEKKEDSKE